MRILVLASRVPYPLDNGEDLRVFHFARYLNPNHELHLVTQGSGVPSCNEATKLFKKIHTIPKKQICCVRTMTARLAKAFSPDHMYHFDPEVRSRLVKLVGEQKFDLIWIPAWQMIPYGFEVDGVPVAVDVMDDGILEQFREIRTSRSLARLAVNLKRMFVTLLFERKYFSRAALCCLAAERDAAVLKRFCPEAKTLVISNGVDLDYFKPLELPEDYPSLIFEGNMSFAPSVDAMVYFCTKTFPLIKQTITGVKLYVVGKDPAPEIQALATNEIIVTGYVEDIRHYLAKASTFVCPMRKGAGIKNKVLQAWAMARPVVATSVALGGLRAVPGENIIVADGPKFFAKEVIRLLNTPSLRDEIGLAGRKTVLEHYSWEQKARSLEEALRSL